MGQEQTKVNYLRYIASTISAMCLALTLASLGAISGRISSLLAATPTPCSAGYEQREHYETANVDPVDQLC